jgi:hypothetical protein
MSTLTLEDIQKFRQALDKNPELFTLVTGSKKQGRKKGSANIPKEIVVEKPINNDEKPLEITKKQALEMGLVKPRKQREMTEEERAVMLERLAKMRAIKAENLAKKKAQEEKTKPAIQVDLDKQTVTQRYIIKGNRPRTARKIVKDESEDEESLITTASESESEIIRKIKRKEKVIDKIDNIIQKSTVNKLDPFAKRRY